MIKASIINEIKNILSKHINPHEFNIFIFGSFAMGKNIYSSDIDLGIEGKNALSASTIVKIQHDLEESNIPYKIDIVDFDKVSDRFKKIAMKQIIPLSN